MIIFAVLTVFIVLSGISMYTFFPVQMPLIGNQVSTGDHAARDNELASEMANKKRGDTLGDQSISEATTDVIQNTDYSGWTVGLASAYGSDSIGVATASGTPLDNYSYTIAVPAEKSYLLGTSVEIGYGGISVTALINDTGGFGAMGRDFDLGPAIWHTFGASTESDWGLRTIYYRFVQ
jgi:rare lipoprotein A (peptidoglycan hydrolase)